MITHAFDFENKTNRQVLDALNAILEQGRGDYDEYEFGLWSHSAVPFPFVPSADFSRDRWVACHAVRGGSEGYWAHIAMLPVARLLPHGGCELNYRLWAACKCWSWENALWMANVAQRFFDQ